MTVRILLGDCRDRLRELPDESVNCVVTSPPYWGLRDYGVAGQLGLEASPDAFVSGLVEVLREVRRVLRGDGTLWLNLGDTYNNSDKWGGGGANTGKHTRAPDGSVESWKAVRRKWDAIPGLKPKDLIGIPWRVAFAMQADGWWLRQDIIWSKANAMPESVTDRCTKAHEYLFLLSKSASYYYDADAIQEDAATGSDLGLLRGRSGVGQVDGVAWHAPSIAKRQAEGVDSRTAGDGKRNKRSVWAVNTAPFSEAHFATFPPALIEPCILAGCPEGGTVLDPFGGAGTTGLVADSLKRNAILIELNPAYAEMAERRIKGDAGMFATVSAA